jgi:hypothetical protein
MTDCRTMIAVLTLCLFGCSSIRTQPAEVATPATRATQQLELDGQKCDPSRIGSSLSVQQVLDILQGIPNNKGEYETTEHYKERTTDAAKLAFSHAGLGSLGADVAFLAPVTDDTTYQYNADTQTLDFYLGILIMQHASSSTSSEINYVFVSSKPKPTSVFSASNAFGVRTDVIKSEENVIGISFPGNSDLPWLRPYTKQSPIHMTPDAARLAKQNLAVLFVGPLVAPFVESGLNYNSATMQLPIERNYQVRAIKIRPTCSALVNKTTGKIILRLPV